ncbi:MAG: TraB/VirB10 family protein [Ahniella sp.]|nr:TraB/VirB10 family protein [Ahniella sp.]
MNDLVGFAWRQRSPQQKRLLLIVVVLVSAGGIAYLFAPPDRPVSTPTPKSLGNVLTSADPRELGLSAIANELKLLKSQVEQSQRIVEPVSPADRTSPELDQLRSELAALRAELLEVRARPAASPAPAPIGMPAANVVPANFQVIEDDNDPEPAATPTVAPAHYLPAGTLVTGRLLYGLDASTASAAIRNPQPVVVRLQHEAILPNRVRFDVRECFMTAAGYGELSSERVMLRSENLSCVRADGQVIDVKLEAVAVGEDGKVGLRGRLVSKQGRAIGLAALAGLAEGASQALGQDTTFIAPGGSSGVLPEAGNRGVSSSLDRVAEFYLDKADRLSPILEVSSAREVTFALVTGVHLNLATQSGSR